MMKDPAILGEGIEGTFLLDDGSVINGSLHWSRETEELKLKSILGEISLTQDQIQGNIDGAQASTLRSLRKCLTNIRTIKAGVAEYMRVHGHNGSERIEKWQKNSCYLLLLQVDHIMNEIPRCTRKWAQYRVKQSPELKISCSYHGSERDILKSIRKIMSSLEMGR
jgi:hypothetical protein